MLDIQNPGTSIQFQDMISKDQMICLSGEFDTLCRESLTNAECKIFIFLGFFPFRNPQSLFPILFEGCDSMLNGEFH